MGAAESLIGLRLNGSRTGRQWEVVERLGTEPGQTPGNFSYGYIVEGREGEKAFMKASDVAMASKSSDPVEALQIATTAHQFERSVLEFCRGNRFDRVVTAIDFGSENLVFDGVQDLVFYIVFELANGDLRNYIYKEQANNLIWIVSAIHSFSIAASQLHGSNIYHNDMKPANSLIFEDSQKIADLGRATSPNFPSQHEVMLCAGDGRFAPPEQLYHDENGAKSIDRFIKSKAGDLYNLGSLIHFLITKRMITPEIIARMPENVRPANLSGGSHDNYSEALPYWCDAFTIVMTEFLDNIPDSWNGDFIFALDEIKSIVMHLCEPNYLLRGDLQPSIVTSSKYSLERIISRMDNIRSRLMVISRAK